MRGRKAGLDAAKVSSIVAVLAENPEGLWLRQIAVRVSFSPATVSHYLNTVIKPLVLEESLGPEEKKPILRVVRLKPYVIEQLRAGKTISAIIRLMKVIGENA